MRPFVPSPRGLATAPLLVLAVLAVLLLALPLGVENPYSLHVMILLFRAVGQGESGNILGGYSGQY